jgi:hypothetical protein
MEAGMKFAHTFCRWNTHVQMKAPKPSCMKPADDREDVLSWQAPQRAKRLGAPLGRRTNSPFKTKEHKL